MRFSQNQLLLAGMIIGILALGAVFLWLAGNRSPGAGVSLSKSFAQEIHEGLQKESEGNQALLDDIDELPIPTENQDQFFLLKNVAVAYQRELGWLQEKENAAYSGMQTENNLAAQDGLKKEISYYVLFQYLQAVNKKVTADVTADSFNLDETIAQTEEQLPLLQSGSLLTPEKIAEFAQQSGLQKEVIQQGLDETVQQFLEFKKNEFSESVTQYEKAVVGQQVITWAFMLQGANAGAAS